MADTGIVERLRAGPVSGDPVFEEAAAAIERLRKRATALQELITEDAHAAVAAQRDVRADALEEAAQVADEAYQAASYEDAIANTIAAAIRALKEKQHAEPPQSRHRL